MENVSLVQSVNQTIYLHLRSYFKEPAAALLCLVETLVALELDADLFAPEEDVEEPEDSA